MKSTKTSVGCLLALSAVLLSCCDRCPDEPGIYCDRANGYFLVFPEDWTVDPDPGNGLAVSAQAPLPQDADPDVKRTTFEVIIVSLRSDPDLGQYFDDYVRKLPEGKPYFQLEDKGEIKLGGKKTKYILYAVDTEPRIEARLEYFQKKGGRIYIFRGVTRGIQFNEFHDKFREIAYTFRYL